MRHVHLLHERIIKQEFDDLELAEMFLSMRDVRPEPSWYADLLDEHGIEIAAVIAAWIVTIRGRLGGINTDEWASVLIWQDFEGLLVESLAPVLFHSASTAMRQQAIQANVPVAIQLGDIEVIEWASQKATQEARLISDETRLALQESLATTNEAGLDDEDKRRLILETGVFGLNRRYAASVLRRALDEQKFDDAFREAELHGERLLRVRGELITTGNTVDSVIEGMGIAALLWSNEGYEVEKTWMTQDDELVCDICAPLHMQTVRRDDYFVDGYGNQHVRSPAHLNCRCFVDYRARVETESVLEAVF